MKKIIDQSWLEEPWFDALKPQFKLAWFYVWTKSDLVGVWSGNRKVADMQLGRPIEWDEFQIALDHRVKVLPSGKWWLTEYCPFQFGNFSLESRVHLAAKRELNRHGVKDLDSLWIAYTEAPKSLISHSHSQGQNGKGSAEGKTVRAKKVLDTSIPENINTPTFIPHWEAWQQHRKEKREPVTPLACEHQLKDLSEWGEARAIAAIHHSIKNGYQGIFEPKTNGTHQPSASTRNIGHNANVSYANRPKRETSGKGPAAGD